MHNLVQGTRCSPPSHTVCHAAPIDAEVCEALAVFTDVHFWQDNCEQIYNYAKLCRIADVCVMCIVVAFEVGAFASKPEEDDMKNIDLSIVDHLYQRGLPQDCSCTAHELTFNCVARG